MFTFKEHQGPGGAPGRTVAFTDVHIQPRSYAELDASALHKRITIQLEMLNGRIVDTDVEGVDTTHPAHFRTTLESPFTSRAIGLVRGGWLPSFLAATSPRATILVDRNIVSELVGRFDKGVRVGREPDFLDLFADMPVRINPMLYAIEGNNRAIPDPALARAQFQEVVEKLRRALPNAELMVGPQSMQGLLSVIDEIRAEMERKERFLLMVAARLHGPLGRKHINSRWSDVLHAADCCEIARNDIVVLAALSSVAVPNGTSIARRVLKIRDHYTRANAYNALADLQSLDLLIRAFGLFPDEVIQLCTADKALALFWCGIQASGFELEDDGVKYTMSPIEALLPGDFAEKWRAAIEGH
jgi:hypothetical protein